MLTTTDVEDRKPPCEEEIRAQLHRIITSTEFPNVGRGAAFLSFIVEETLAGRASRIKGYAIALEVFKRDEKFTQEDPWSESRPDGSGACSNATTSLPGRRIRYASTFRRADMPRFSHGACPHRSSRSMTRRIPQTGLSATLHSLIPERPEMVRDDDNYISYAEGKYMYVRVTSLQKQLGSMATRRTTTVYQVKPAGRWTSQATDRVLMK